MAASMAGAVDLSGLKRTANTGEGAPTSIAGAVEVTEANFEAEVLVRSTQVPVVVVLWSPRSEVSAQLAEVLAALAAQDGGKWALAAVNIDVVPQIAQAFGIQGIPAVVALAAGRPLTNFEGAQPPEQLRKWIDSILQATAGKLAGGGDADAPEPVDPGLAAARDALDAGDFEAARAAYSAFLEGNPTKADATEAEAAIRQIDFLTRAMAHAPAVVAEADAAPENIDLAFAAADVQLLNQDPDGAFSRLIDLVKRTAGDERTTVRTRLIELFELIDPADPAVITGRRNLATALY